MFPAPVSGNPGKVCAYRLALAASLALWLLPIAAVAFTSIRPLEDITRGNIWGWPSKLSRRSPSCTDCRGCGRGPGRSPSHCQRMGRSTGAVRDTWRSATGWAWSQPDQPA